MTPLTDNQKREILNLLGMGDIVLCTNGKQYEFVRMKKTKFIGKRDGATYDVPYQMFVEVVSRQQNTRFDSSQLQKGELFYILNNKQEAVVFRFKYMINADKVMAENPVTNTGVRVGAGLVKGRVSELKKS